MSDGIQRGDKARVRGRLNVWHYLIVVGPVQGFGNVWMAAHNAKGDGVRLDPLTKFTSDPTFQIVQRLPEAEQYCAAVRAVGLVGRKYDLLTFNCEHYANLVQGTEVKSDQVREAGFVFAAGLLFGAALASVDAPVQYDRTTGRYRDKKTGQFRSR